MLSFLDFQPLEVVSRYRDPQPQVAENYSYLLIWEQYLQIFMFNHLFFFMSLNCCLIKQVENYKSRVHQAKG